MFAIRQKATGWWLPRFSGQSGGTLVEPSLNAIPRLFATRRHAEGALRWWLEGKVVACYTKGGEYDGDLMTRPQAHRNADDMEIIEVRLEMK